MEHQVTTTHQNQDIECFHQLMWFPVSQELVILDQQESSKT